MAETVNIGEIASRISEDIFGSFHWKFHPLRDVNFKCENPAHLTEGAKPRRKDTHPADVVFFYEDPYLGHRVYLHTDLKSYGKDSVGPGKLRSAFKSLAMTIECARESEHWRRLYSIDSQEQFSVRGLLFVHNHDHKYRDDFASAIEKAGLSTIDIAPFVYIHFLGPSDINRLYSIANDLMRLQQQKTLPANYSFYYPDLVMWHRHGDVWGQPATIETLTAPYFIIKYPTVDKLEPGYLIYYNRQGASADEFVYFLDSLSRYQMLGPDEFIRIRIVHEAPHEDFKNNFLTATTRYAKAWGFDPSRQTILENITIDRVTAIASTYTAGAIGWRAKK